MSTLETAPERQHADSSRPTRSVLLPISVAVVAIASLVCAVVVFGVTETLLNVALAIFAFAFALTSIGGDTYHKGNEPLYQRITHRGWCAILLLVLTLFLQVWKEVYTNQERAREKEELRQETRAVETEHRLWIQNRLDVLAKSVSENIEARNRQLAELNQQRQTASPDQKPAVERKIQELTEENKREKAALAAINERPSLVVLEWRRGKNRERFHNQIIPRLRALGYRVKATSGKSTGPIPKIVYHPENVVQAQEIAQLMHSLSYAVPTLEPDGKTKDEIFVYTAD